MWFVSKYKTKTKIKLKKAYEKDYEAKKGNKGDNKRTLTKPSFQIRPFY